jgi:predicted DNA-binding protein YlxM (UPF0122 family)
LCHVLIQEHDSIARQRGHVLQLFQAGEHTIAELGELFSVSRATIYREIHRAHRDPTLT